MEEEETDKKDQKKKKTIGRSYVSGEMSSDQNNDGERDQAAAARLAGVDPRAPFFNDVRPTLQKISKVIRRLSFSLSLVVNSHWHVFRYGEDDQRAQ